MSSLLEIKNLNTSVKKDGKQLKIINNINFEIKEGEILGLAGESGCGKSITALSIVRLLPYNIRTTSGEINYKNSNLLSLTEKEMCSIRGNEISVIFQDVRQSLNPLIKIGKQITETLELGGSTDKQENKNKTLEMLSILGFNNPEKVFNAFPHQLSGGMCQRIMTAIAVIRRPKLLLGDEPSSSLDDESRRKCLSLLKEMNQSFKMSVLLISHDLSILKQYCSRFLIMYAGRIVEEGVIESLYSPKHPYTRALVNAIPHKDKCGKNLENIPGKIPSVEDQLPGCPFKPRCTRAKPICGESFPQFKDTELNKVYCHFPFTGAVDE